MEISKLSKRVIEDNIEKLLELEQRYSGNPDELWGRDNFLMEVEGKFDLSRVAFDGNNIAGYVIISIRREDERIFGYVNRTFVNPRYRNSSVYVRMFLSARLDLKKLGLNVLRWKCSVDNKRVYEYHLSFADEIIRQESHQGKVYSLFQKRIG